MAALLNDALKSILAVAITAAAGALLIVFTHASVSGGVPPAEPTPKAVEHDTTAAQTLPFTSPEQEKK